jgi:hypothetical protein
MPGQQRRNPRPPIRFGSAPPARQAYRQVLSWIVDAQWVVSLDYHQGGGDTVVLRFDSARGRVDCRHWDTEAGAMTGQDFAVTLRDVAVIAVLGELGNR